jgi:[pyruvate, water dikinase]-phosphate phosphotransferase / [pyruvate, water dikinase] kinase
MPSKPSMTNKKSKDPSFLSILIVSDATGGTAMRLVRSALVQFSGARVNLIERGQTNTPERISAIVQEAAKEKALILHTLVSSDLRGLMLQQSRLLGVDSMDIMGPVLDRLSVFLKLKPKEEPGIYSHLGEGKTREIEAVDFAFHHDDGQGVDDIDKAEVVLVGVSRSMKTPTMLYLAYHGWFAANVPLILEIPPPPPLLAIPKEKVFCLISDEGHLLTTRSSRARIYDLPPSPYTSPEYIRTELSYARMICRDNHWRLIETAGKSIEEITREIIELLTGGEDMRRRDKKRGTV